MLFLLLALSACTSTETKISRAISRQYGGTVHVLEFAPASRRAPDSMIVVTRRADFGRFADQAIGLIAIGADASLVPVRDSMDRIKSEIERAQAGILADTSAADDYFFCRSVITTDNNTEKRRDTITAILDNGFNLVWRGN